MTSILDRLDSTHPAEPEPVGAQLQSSFKPTEEQEAIIDAAVNSQDNLLISALAGAAKTSTLVLVANRPEMQEIPTLCLAFNKKIAEEMRARLPSNCVSLTLHSLGNKAWSQAIGRRMKLNYKKSYEIVKELIDAIKEKHLKDQLYENFSDLTKTVGHAKSSGWVPKSCPRSGTHSLWDSDDEFFQSLDEQLEASQEKIIEEALLISIERAYRGDIDFDDMIYMPTCFPAKFPSYPLTMIDESQDLSALNHFMLDQIVNGNRLIAVGDPCQAIYAFRGAYGDSMERLRQKFNMRELVLSTSFRCPKAVVKEAQWRAPNMVAPEWAEDGSVKTCNDWGVEVLTQDAVIICRNNAPIFKMAIILLQEGRYPEIVGNDLRKTLMKALEKLGPRDMDQAKTLEKFEAYRVSRLSKARPHAKDSVEDFCRCLEIFIRNGETLGGAINYADHIMNSVGPVKMMTGHKSKGLEFHNVYILDRQLLRMEDGEDGRGKNQDRNLLYVMQTRAQRTLTYITTEGFVPANVETKLED